MGRVSWQEHIIVDPNIHHGDPCIRGTRVPVTIIVGSLADDMMSEEIIERYPQLTSDDIRAALAYAAEVLHEEVILPLSA